jgi:hypothetical protein
VEENCKQIETLGRVVPKKTYVDYQSFFEDFVILMFVFWS